MTWPRRTKTSVALVKALLVAPDESHYGYQLMADTGMASGVMYPLLHRLERCGWITSDWEVTRHGAPARRVYRLTKQGQIALPDYLEG